MKLVAPAFVMLAFTTGAIAVSVGELISKCGDDAKVYCDGVGRGDAMTQASSSTAPTCGSSASWLAPAS